MVREPLSRVTKKKIGKEIDTKTNISIKDYETDEIEDQPCKNSWWNQNYWLMREGPFVLWDLRYNKGAPFCVTCFFC